MMVNGRAEITRELSAAAAEQLQLRYRFAAAAADLYLQAKFSVVYQDIILGPHLTEVVQYYQSHPLHVVVLCPTPAVVAAREAGAGKNGLSRHNGCGPRPGVTRGDATARLMVG